MSLLKEQKPRCYSYASFWIASEGRKAGDMMLAGRLYSTLLPASLRLPMKFISLQLKKALKGMDLAQE